MIHWLLITIVALGGAILAVLGIGLCVASRSGDLRQELLEEQNKRLGIANEN